MGDFIAEAGKVYTVEEIPLPLLANAVIDENYRSVSTDCQDTLDILFEKVEGGFTLEFALEMSDGYRCRNGTSATGAQPPSASARSGSPRDRYGCSRL